MNIYKTPIIHFKAFPPKYSETSTKSFETSVLKNLERNFGGLPQEILDKIKQIYYEELPSNKLDKNICYYEYNPISFIDENLKSSNNNSRYLMLLNNSPINDFLITSILKYLKY